jgi:hypothetical protein
MCTARLPVVDWTDASRRFKWTRPFRQKTKSGFCACAITFQTQSTTVIQPVDCNHMTRKVTVERVASILHNREVSGSNRNFEKGYVAWRDALLPGDSVLHIQAMLPGDKLCCLCRGYVFRRKVILPEFYGYFASFSPRHVLWHYLIFDHYCLHVPSISLLIDNRTVWYHCNTLRVTGSVIKYTVNKSLLRKTWFLYNNVTFL